MANPYSGRNQDAEPAATYNIIYNIHVTLQDLCNK